MAACGASHAEHINVLRVVFVAKLRDTCTNHKAIKVSLNMNKAMINPCCRTAD
jgi:hypothetical protein